MNETGMELCRNDGTGSLTCRNAREGTGIPEPRITRDGNGYFAARNVSVLFPRDTGNDPVKFAGNLRGEERIRTPGGARISRVHTQLSPPKSAYLFVYCLLFIFTQSV